MISSRINAITTTKINNSVNTFPPYVILLLLCYFPSSIINIVSQGGLNEKNKEEWVGLFLIFAVITMFCAKLLLWIGVFVLILSALLLLVLIIKSLCELK